MPLANSLRSREQLDAPEPKWPLELVRCPACTLLQITETVPPVRLFSQYEYFSSFSDTMVAHAKQLAESLTHSRDLSGDSLVVEVASNDGYLLQWYQAAGVPVLGIEPAENIAKVAREKRYIETVVDFFGEDVALDLVLAEKQADVIHANNVLAHIEDINGVIRGFKTLLKPGGVVVIETPYAGDFLDKNEFDTIYHEHLFYYSLTALNSLFARHGLAVVDVKDLDIHGGSIRVTAMHQQAATILPSVAERLAKEVDWVASDAHHRGFAERVTHNKQTLLACLNELKQSGHSIAAYGASAKGSTLLNYFGIDESIIDFIVDRSTVKQGKFTPGLPLPILPAEALAQRRPDYCLLLTWNFADEILSQQSAYREAGGQFIVPVPEVRIV
ncbi:MAG: class I SAM-dependent methyltransferase [Planctomycetota bacterium]